MRASVQRGLNESIQSKIVEPATYRSSLYRKGEVLKHYFLASDVITFYDKIYIFL